MAEGEGGWRGSLFGVVPGEGKAHHVTGIDYLRLTRLKPSVVKL